MSDHSDYFTVFLVAYIVLSFEVFGRVILPRLRSGRFKDFWDRKFHEEISLYTLPPILTLIVIHITIIFLAELTISYLGPGTSEDIFRFYFVILLAIVPTAIFWYSVVHLFNKISDSLILMYPVVRLFDKISDSFARRADPRSAWCMGDYRISPILMYPVVRLFDKISDSFSVTTLIKLGLKSIFLLMALFLIIVPSIMLFRFSAEYLYELMQRF